MSEETGLAVVKKSDLLAPSPLANEEALQATEVDTQYLPYIQLMYATSGYVTEGKASLGCFTLTKGQAVINLEKSFDFVPLSWRPRAMYFGEDVISIYDVKNPEFAKIKEQAANGVRKYSYGKEFLIYVPAYDELACFFFGNKSMRMEAPNVTSILNEQAASEGYIVAQVSSRIVGGKDRYPVPSVEKSDTVLSKMADDQRLEAALKTFNNPKDTEIETVDEDERER